MRAQRVRCPERERVKDRVPRQKAGPCKRKAIKSKLPPGTVSRSQGRHGGSGDLVTHYQSHVL